MAPRQLPAFNRRRPQTAAVPASGLLYGHPFDAREGTFERGEPDASVGGRGSGGGGRSPRRALLRRPEHGVGRDEAVGLGRGCGWWRWLAAELLST